MKSKSIQWLKNSKNYEYIKEVLFKLEMGEKLSEEEVTLLIKLFNILKDQENYKNLIKKIRVYFFLYQKIDFLFLEYILAEGIFPILENYFLNNKFYMEEKHNFKNTFYKEVLNQYKYEGKTLTYDQDKFFNNLSKEKMVVYSAPTSFGKSTAIINKIRLNMEKTSLIIVPSKMLVSQFSRDIIEKLKLIPITHPDQENLKSNIYVLTQERAQTILNENKEIKFDLVFVDEAHHMLESDSRSIKLTTLIINILYRNPDTNLNYFTPFKTDFKYETNKKYSKVFSKLNDIKQEDFEEKIKIKRYFIKFNKKTFLYNEVLEEKKEVNYNENQGNQILYFNKGKDILNFIDNNIKNKKEEKELKDLEEYIGNGIELFRGAKKGMYPIFGAIPYNISNYMLEEFIENSNGLLVVNSAALEGINTNAKSIYIYDRKKGISNLKSYELENLIGRANRLSDVILDNERLVTDVFFVVKEEEELKTVINYLNKELKIKTLKNNNIILKEDLEKEEELIIDNQIEEDFNGKNNVKTEVGKLLAFNNFCQVNIEKEEMKIQERIDKIKKIKEVDPLEIINIIVETFLIDIEYDLKEKNNIKRLEAMETRKYYSIIFNYFIKNSSLKQIINNTVNYWKSQKEDLVYIGKFGNQTRPNNQGHSYKKYWINIKNMSDSDLYKYSTIKTFVEIDFMELAILPFLKILYDLGKVEKEVYNIIVYSTNIPEEIELKKMGISNELFNELKNHIDLKNIFSISKKEKIYLKDKVVNKIMKKEYEMIFDLLGE